MPKDFKRSTRRVVQTALATPWMIELGTLHQIMALLEARSNGTLLSRDEITERIGRPAGSASGVIKAASLNFEPDDDSEGPYVVDGVAVLPLFGVLAPRLSWMDEVSGGTSTELFQMWFREAMNDTRVNSILIHVDSPGGSAQGNEEVAQLMRSGRGTKKINSVATGLMASAAYYDGSAADRIFASPSSEIGSVGAYMIHGESSAQDAAEGVKYTVIKAGENKAAGNAVEPLTPKTKAILQERIDAFYDQFVSAVATNRGVSVATVEANYGQGKVMIARAALTAGLIDEIATFEQVLDSMRTKQTAAKSPRGAASGLRTDEPAGTVPPAATSETPREVVPVVKTTHEQGGSAMIKIKAALIAKGLCAADATDEQMNATVATFCAGRGVSVPKSEDEIVELINPSPKKVDEKAVRAAERTRINDLQARGALLKIGATEIQTAIDDGLDVPTALARWTEKATSAERPVDKKIVSGAQEDDVFQGAAVAGLFMRADPGNKKSGTVSKEVRDASRMSMLDIGRRMLARDQSESRIDMYDGEEVAKAMLMGDNPGRHLVAIRSDASGAGYNRPGDFPGILSGLMGKMLDKAEELASATYSEWTSPMESVVDFKPKTIHAIGEFGELPEHEDAKKFDESQNGEEAAWIQAAEYGDNWTLTPRMVINDDLGVLQEVANAKQDAHDLTLERLCVNLLTGNAPAQDGYNLFDPTNRVATVAGQTVNINDIIGGSGGVPSTTQLALMRKYARKIYGLNLKQKLNQSIKLLLIPEDLETVTEQLLWTGAGVVPTTEGNAQIFRGKVAWKVVPMLAEANQAMWYGITDSSRKAIATTHMKGYEQMKATSYYDPTTGCRVWNFVGRMAAAIRTWRTIFRNAGV
jgi:signal peptide peptidase SppA